MVFDDVVAEIKSKPLTHAFGIGMGQNEMSGTFLSTETINRYTPRATKVLPAKVDIKTPYVLRDWTELSDLRNSVLPEAVEGYLKKYPEIVRDFPQLVAEMKKAEAFDADVFTNFPDFDVEIGNLVTEKLKSKGFDSAYLRESADSEGILVVFDRKKVRFQEK